MPTDDDADDGRGRSTLDEVAEALAGTARSALSDVLRAINAYAQENKGAAARQMSDYADAADHAASALKARDNDLGARLLGEVSTQMSRASTTVSGATADDLADGIETAARRNPTAFAAGAILAGVALGYLLKAAAAERTAERDDPSTPATPSRLPTEGSSSESTP